MTPTPVAVLAALAIGGAATTVAWHLATHQDDALAAAALHQHCDDALQALAVRMAAYEQVLVGGAALFESGLPVTRPTWRRWSAAQRLETRFPGIQGIGWAVRIAPGERAAHERGVRAEGFADYAVHPAGERELMSAIVFLEPFEGRNLRAFGFDMASEATRREAMQRAAASDRPALSGKVTLVQETEHDRQPGVLMYVPVRGPAGLAGWVYAPFRMHDLLRGALGTHGDPLLLTLRDGSQPHEDDLLYTSAAGQAAGRWSHRDELPIGGRTWRVECISSRALEASAPFGAPRLVAGGGALATLALAGLVALLGRSRAHALALAERAGAADRAKGDFLNRVTHELKTPLNAVIGFCELLAAGVPQPLPALQQRHAADALDGGRQLLAIVDDVLTYVRAEQGELAARDAPLDLAIALPAMLGAERARAQARGQRFAVEVEPGLGQVRLDRDLLARALRNLADNAVKFAPEQGHVDVAARHRDHGAAGPQLEITVRDDGPGVEAAVREHLFEPFCQGAATLTRTHGGTGLGLALAARIVQAMGGRLELAAGAPGEGARFVITLPLQPNPEEVTR